MTTRPYSEILQGGTESRSQEGEELPKLDSAEECPANRRKKTIRIPVAMTSTDTALTLDVLVQGKEYEFIVDTGADVSLIQPYVGDEPTEELSDVVRGITGEALEIEGTRRLEIEIGNQRCTHDFVVASFPLQKDGIIGLDLLIELEAYIDMATDEVTLRGQVFKQKDRPPGGTEANQPKEMIGRTEPRPVREAKGESGSTKKKTVTKSRGPAVEAVRRLAGQLRQARRRAQKKLAYVRRAHNSRHNRPAWRTEYRTGQLVCRKSTGRGRKPKPKWLGPYQVLKRISDLVYTIQVGKKEVNVHVEQLKLCRASREELRERRKQNRQRRREWRPQQVREDSESSSSDSSSEEGGSEPLHSSKPYERRGVNEYNRRRSGSVPTKDGTARRNEDSSDSESEDGDDWPLYRYAQNESHSRTERDSRVSKNAAAAEEADTRANAQREGLDSNEQDSQISGNVSAVEETETEQTAERDANSAVGNVDASADHPPRASESTEGQHGYTLRPRPQRNYKE